MVDGDTITIVHYMYKVGDLVEFKTFNGLERSHVIHMGLVTRRYLQDHLWYREAKKQIQERGKSFLTMYDIMHENIIYAVKERDILKRIS